MGSVDWPLEKLVDYKPDSTAQDDFDAFWCRNKAERQKVPLNASFEAIQDALPMANVYDVGFDGVEGVRV